MRYISSAIATIMTIMLNACCYHGQSFEAIHNTRTTHQSIEERAEQVALTALAEWINSNPNGADQIRGARLHEFIQLKEGYRVTLSKNNSAYYDNGRMKEEGMHISFFHVYLDSDLKIIKVERGPDQIS